ncbi:AbrB/MazE/SpoVT family DNA-binding domain-containing protein [Aetokthonos hydrillicola Thurmond2011]|uniref:AbrB/MazE/SpoVT family DNA-binding domain-containing protein n=1 Tax=Aetokthonos hydrillicola Thurmond2011 TaxID=2712845 RepID=A0AAP5I874_9CYAN|nr:AbrB/MazE/SpoVT family DNA-binding domain-containing protein [Aetokthonos hydrillicola]MBO3463354.1 AbrB/MazE/SpoVT family DNA-binding domain-containing protein [Aetokthonos hydrillicola CCALA 1050]MBW4583752.1 AbrB/MazE/SpoVT family DNA-binding domain-containing protein [Aetokthonos hydrillicola CCALA 1050]MDR9895554.1 AbrB/MazE/SpoVT family DNA-binding domain-containing protein [Aetokthonos hydrillicola Thurmond2011]
MEINSISTKVTDGGRIVIPADYRRALELKVGDDVVLSLEGKEIRMLSRKEALRRAKALVRRYVPKGTLLSDELLTQRQREARDD